MVKKDLDLEPKIDAMMREFLDLEVLSGGKNLAKKWAVRSFQVEMDPAIRRSSQPMFVERASVLHQPNGVGSQMHHIVPIEELNGVLIALVARKRIRLKRDKSEQKRTKPDKNGKRGEARKIQEQSSG
nr:hypothetical protein [Tanacetum cinerariifolium]